MNKIKALIIALGYLLIYVLSVFATMFMFRSLFAVEGFRPFYEQNPVSLLVVSNAIVLPIYYFIFRWRGKNLIQFCQFRRLAPRTLWLTLPLGLSLGTLIYSISALPVVTTYFPDIATLTEMIGNGGNILMVLLGSVLLGSLAEEILFRGLIMRTLHSAFRLWLALLLQALFFGVLTFSVTVGLYAALGAVLFGLIFIWSGSLWASLIAHMISTSTIFLFFQIGDRLTQTVGYALFALGMVMLITFLWVLKRSSSPSVESTTQTGVT
jgi:membrane protease YdiL (CAAX protease family)